jgi:hypothetical protein
MAGVGELVGGEFAEAARCAGDEDCLGQMLRSFAPK